MHRYLPRRVDPQANLIAPDIDEIYAYGFRNPWRFSFDTVTGNYGYRDFGFCIPADFTGNCAVDIHDFVELAAVWLKSDPYIDFIPLPNGDGIVGIGELAIVAEHWLEGVE